MKVLWLSWKDIEHPDAGGAEVVQDELCARLVHDGHEVVVLTSRPKNAATTTTHNGYKIVRAGGRFTVYWAVYRYYKQNLKGWADLVVDEVNTIPFFAGKYVGEPNVAFFHQLSREIWFYQFAHLGLIGYWLEPLYLKLLKSRQVITVSNSTKTDLVKNGFPAENIHIISEGIESAYIAALPPMSDKFDQPTVLSLGSIRPMKRTMHQVRAFERAKQHIPELHMVIAGDSRGKYGAKVLKAIGSSKYSSDITYAGRVSHDDKVKLMRGAHVILVTSIKEGWGLVVTEANASGTPAVVYNVSGLRDSVRHGVTGLVTDRNNPTELAEKIVELLQDPVKHLELRQAAWEWSQTITFEQSYEDFIVALDL